MRILICNEFYHPSIGGVQTVARQVAEGLVRRGHEVTVATSAMPERQAARLNGVAIEGFAVAGNRVRGMAGEVERYVDFVTRFEADALLVQAAQQWSFDALWPILPILRLPKYFIPCGFSRLGDPAYADYFAALPAVLGTFDGLIFHSPRFRDIDFARAHGLARLVIIPNGASAEEFGQERPRVDIRKKLGIGKEHFLFLTVGSRTGLKGHEEVAEAYLHLQSERPTTLVVNGNTSRVRPLKAAGRAFRAAMVRGLEAIAGRAVGRPHTPERVRYWLRAAAGQGGKQVLDIDLGREDLIGLFAAADLFVFASNVEYSPLVLYESVAAGTPFLSVPVGNAAQIAAWTGGGLILDAAVDGDGLVRAEPRRLAAAMRSMMSDPDQLAALGQAGREAWRRHFTWEAIVDRYEAVLAGGDVPDFPEGL